MARRWIGGPVLVLVLLYAIGAQAEAVTFDVSLEFTGSTPPEGAAPWIRATFDDGGTPGSVTMTLASVNLVGAEFVNEWSFNLDPSLSPANLLFSAPTKNGTFSDPVIAVGVDSYQAAGDGRYDIQVSFDNSPPANRFGSGDSVQYTISGIGTLTASSFDFVAAPGGGLGPFRTAAHVQAIGTEGGSGWVTVPEPGAALLVLLTIAGTVQRRLRA